MSEDFKCIMLVDDDTHDNFFHERAIKKNDIESIVITKTSGTGALDYLKAETSPRPDIIFLDINMPGMNGWEFLKEYSQLDTTLHSRAVIIMLSTSNSPTDMKRAGTWDFVADFVTKPLTRERMQQIIAKISASNPVK